MAEASVWVMQRRVVPADRAERLRKEPVEIDAEVARLEATDVVIGQFIEAERTGRVSFSRRPIARSKGPPERFAMRGR
ncbi:hypothetical protein ACWCXH_06065 [Kitasatospora sp. NPDC001660]